MVLPRNEAEAWNRRVLQRLLRLARDRVRPYVPSRTLRRDVQMFVDQNRRGILQWPYYWAGMIHAGYGRRYPRTAKVLIWFKNPRNDPRTQGGKKYPRRKQEIRRLTTAQYEVGLKRNRERPPQSPYMVVVKSAPGAPPRPFIDQGLRNVSPEAGRIVLQEFNRLVLRTLLEDEDTVNLVL